MITRILQESDARVYHQLRLAGLQSDPEAFGATYERESTFALEAIVERIRPTEGKFAIGAFSESGLLIGIVTFVRDGGLKTSHKGNLYGMYVSREFRGQGAGKQLMLEVIRLARQCEGLEQLNLTVVSTNESAKRLYASLGFETYGVERRALKHKGKYYDEDLMVLSL